MQVISFQPVAEWLLVQRASKPEEKRTPEGIVIPESSVVAIPKAMVLAIGDKVPLDIKPGDEIVLNKYSGEDIAFGELILTTVRWDEIKLVIKYREEPDPVTLATPDETLEVSKAKARRKAN
jgi:chaperonin GroES